MNDWENPKPFPGNRVTAPAYSFSCADEASASTRDCGASARLIPLNGTWPFHRATMPGLSIGSRLTALAVAAACLAVLVVALRLTPDASGMGTHRELGLQECGFLATTGLPCPSCGMTTSYVYFVRGQWVASVYVQPMGFVLAVLTGVIFWVGLYESITGRAVHRLLAVLPMRYHLFPLLALLILAWGWKMYIYVNGMDGW